MVGIKLFSYDKAPMLSDYSYVPMGWFEDSNGKKTHMLMLHRSVGEGKVEAEWVKIPEIG